MTPPGRPEEIFVSSMWFVDETDGFALAFPNGGPEELLRTRDKGLHWQPAYSWPS
jgi:hypothetical protein